MARRIAVLTALVTLLVVSSGAPAEAMKLRRMMAPTAVCKKQNDANAPRWRQQRVMRCLTNYARRRAGLPRLARARALNSSSTRKGQDIIRCDSFSHFACGRQFTFWLERVNYIQGCWQAGENLAWGTGSYATPRAIFAAWMRSPDHRANILGSQYSQIGVSLRVGSLDGSPNAHVWVQHFGDHC
jgi:uncharacterized protein YkwD